MKKLKLELTTDEISVIADCLILAMGSGDKTLAEKSARMMCDLQKQLLEKLVGLK